MSINLRNVVGEIMRNWGEDVILYRLCTCVDSEIGSPGSPAPTCPDCHASGYKTPAEKHKARKMQVISEDQAATYQDEGVVQKDNQWFFFKHTVVPRPGDMIVVDDPSAPKGKVGYKVMESSPLKGVHGRIEFFKAGARREWPK